MRRHELLQGLHKVLQPRTYFEIGVRRGVSLGLSRARTVGVDPYFEVTNEFRCDAHLVRTTSDEFFARQHPFAHFDQPLIDLAFIDGMHLSEFALRDFINTERFCGPGSVVVLDDVLPRKVVEAGRGRVGSAATGAWAGDVFKLIDTLRTLRPDLVILEMDTFPTGTLVVMNLDPDSDTLLGAYDRLVREYVVPDPQALPEWSTTRSRAQSGESLLGSGIWGPIRRLRELPPAESRPRIREVLRREGVVTVEAA